MAGSFATGLFLLLTFTVIIVNNGYDASINIGHGMKESRRLTRHARDEIDWPEGRQRHNRREKLKFEEKQAKDELHRMEYLESKKLPLLEARATRVGNSKKDRAKLEKNQKLMGEIEHARLVENREARLSKKRKNKQGLPAFFPEIELDEEATNYVEMRASRNRGPDRKEELRREAWKRKRAHEELLSKRRNGDEETEGFAPLDNHAKPYKRKRRADHIARVANAQAQASNTPYEVELRRQEDAHNRQIERLERAQTLEIDLESKIQLGSLVASSHLEWIHRLPKVSRLAWGLPLVILHVYVNGNDAIKAIEEFLVGFDLKNVDEEAQKMDRAWFVKRKTIEVWSKAEECLNRLLSSLANAEYLNDMVDLHIHLKLPPKTSSLTNDSKDASISGKFFNREINMEHNQPFHHILPEAMALFELASDFVWSHGRKNVTFWDDNSSQEKDKISKNVGSSFSPINNTTRIDPLEYLSQWSPIDGVNELGVFFNGLQDEVSPSYYAWLKASVLYLNYDEYQEDSIKFIDQADYFSSHGAKLVGFDLGGGEGKGKENISPPYIDRNTSSHSPLYLLKQSISQQKTSPFMKKSMMQNGGDTVHGVDSVDENSSIDRVDSHDGGNLGTHAFALWGDVWWELRGYVKLRLSLKKDAEVQLLSARDEGGGNRQTPSDAISERNIDINSAKFRHLSFVNSSFSSQQLEEKEAFMSLETLLAEFLTAHNFFLLHADFARGATISQRHEELLSSIQRTSKVALSEEVTTLDRSQPPSLHVKWPGKDILKSSHQPLFPDLIAMPRYDCFGFKFYQWDPVTKTNILTNNATVLKRALVRWVKQNQEQGSDGFSGSTDDDQDEDKSLSRNQQALRIKECLDLFLEDSKLSAQPKLDIFRSISSCIRKNIRKSN